MPPKSLYTEVAFSVPTAMVVGLKDIVGEMSDLIGHRLQSPADSRDLQKWTNAAAALGALRGAIYRGEKA